MSVDATKGAENPQGFPFSTEGRSVYAGGRDMSTARVGVRMAVCAGVLVAALWGGLTWADVTKPDGVAVIIGNKDYAYTEDVEFAHRDAEAFARYVVEVLGFDPTHVLLKRDAPLRWMFATFGQKDHVEGTEIWSMLKPGKSDVVVFYSGHGVPGLRNRRGYLVPVDAEPDKAEFQAYSLDLLHENLGRLDARSVTVFVDSCFSGDSEAGMLFKGVSAVRSEAGLPEGPEVTLMTAATGKQVALWDREARHGLFTRHLLDGLYGDADADRDGRITAGEAKEYLDKHMTQAAREGPGRRTQTATLRGGEDKVLAVARFPGRSSPESGAVAAELEKTRLAMQAVSRERDRLAKALEVKEEALGKLGGERDALVQRRAELAREIEAQRQELAKARSEQERLTATVAEQEAELKRLREREGPESMPQLVEAALGLAHADFVTIQRGLVSLGKRLGRVDGVFGKRTRRAILEWQGERGVEATGYLTRDQAEALKVAGQGVQVAVGILPKPEPVKRQWEVGEVFRDCSGCPEMVVVGAGAYMMGSPEDEQRRDEDESPRHRVRIGEAFAVGKYEVTVAEYREFVGEAGRDMSGGCRFYHEGEGMWKTDAGRSWMAPGFEQGDREPVVCVSWEDARMYVEWLSRKTGEEYRLLSEAEWEYVARAGTTGPFHYGWTITTEQANYDGNYSYGSGTKGEYRERTVRVGSFGANGFGLHDVHGNVWEWVEDCWHGDYSGAPDDGSAWTSGGDCGKRVLRGGSWYDAPRVLRSANRDRLSTGSRYYIIGFRIARTLTP